MLMHSVALFLVTLLLVSALISIAALAQQVIPSSCVNDPVAPSILLNNSMSYADRVALYYSDAYTYSAYVTAWYNNHSVVRPYLCPQISTNAFTPGRFLKFYFSASQVRNVMNVTTEGVTCGAECFRVQPAGADRSPVGTFEGTAFAMINSTNDYYSWDGASSPPSFWSVVTCLVTIPSTTPQDAFCTAFIRYNSTYYENGTVYASPSAWSSEALATLDASTTFLSVGKASPFTIWLPPSLTFCPWYFNLGSNNGTNTYVNSNNFVTSQALPMMTVEFNFFANGTNLTFQNEWYFPLVGALCEEALSPHPVSGGAGVRYTGSISPELVRGAVQMLFKSWDILQYNLSISYFRMSYFLPPFHVVPAGVNESQLSLGGNLPRATLRYQGTIVPSRSPWWPTQNYSLPELQNVPTRCYASSPVAMDNSSTILSRDTLICTVGVANNPLFLNITSDTSFCCSAFNASSSSFVWPGFISVNDAGLFWFTDTAGIVVPATPAPTTRKPTTSSPSGGTPNPSTGGSGESASGDDGGKESTTASTSSGSSSQSVAAAGEDTALILGIAVIGICTVLVVIALVYFKWWRPRQEGDEEGGDRSKKWKHNNNNRNNTGRNGLIHQHVNLVELVNLSKPPVPKGLLDEGISHVELDDEKKGAASVNLEL